MPDNIENNVIEDGSIKIAILKDHYQLSLGKNQHIKIPINELTRVIHVLETVKYGDGYIDYAPKPDQNVSKSLLKPQKNGFISKLRKKTK